MPISEKLMRTSVPHGSRIVYGTPEEADWIYEKIQRPSSYWLAAMNLLNWKLRRPRVRGIVALMVEAVFDCNLRCAYCYRTMLSPHLQERPRLMDWETFARWWIRRPVRSRRSSCAAWANPRCIRGCAT